MASAGCDGDGLGDGLGEGEGEGVGAGAAQERITSAIRRVMMKEPSNLVDLIFPPDIKYFPGVLCPECNHLLAIYWDTLR